MDALQPDFCNKDSKQNGDWRVGIEAKHYYYTLENIPGAQIHQKPNKNPRVIDHCLIGRDYVGGDSESTFPRPPGIGDFVSLESIVQSSYTQIDEGQLTKKYIAQCNASLMR